MGPRVVQQLGQGQIQNCSDLEVGVGLSDEDRKTGRS